MSRRRDSLKRANEKRASRRDKKKRETLKGGVMIVGVVVASIVTLSFLFSGDNITIDEDFCPTNAPLEAHSIVLVDATDNISSGDLEIVRQRVHYISEQLTQYEKFSMFELSGDSQGQPQLREIFSLCSPGRGSEVDTRSNSAKRAEFRFRSKFEEPLDNSLSELEELQEGESTPLLASLQQISMRSDFTSDVSNRSLYLVSDLLQHSPDLSQYRSDYDFQRARDDQVRGIVSELSGMDVEIFYIRRPKVRVLQSRAHRQFWENFFDASGARMRFNPPL